MGRINVLEKHVAELIAAGEVVERPSSVIKELVENSIDAGSTAITVEIKNGGTTFMRVTDNGCGIMREDVPNAFLRHATSKVLNEKDLDSIATLGFRGEALASVSAVAKVEILTCADNEDVGTSYTIEGGDEISFGDAGCPVGTTIIVRDLFYNIPARQKFLKKDVAEGNAVSLVMDRIALSHPEISFTFIRDSKQVLKTSGDGQLRSAIYSVFGREFANNLIDVDYELNGVRVTGFISTPSYSRPNRNMQTFFVNNRYVRSRTAGAAIDEAAKGSVMVGKFLCCVLNISMSFAAVDVNVHPAKIEVRFVNERPLFDAVYHGVKSALLKGDKRKEVVLDQVSQKTAVSPFAQFDLRSKDMSKPVVKQEVKQSVTSYIPDLPKKTPDLKKSVFVKPEPEVFVSSPTKSAPLYNRNISVADSQTKEKISNVFTMLDESITKRETVNIAIEKDELCEVCTDTDSSSANVLPTLVEESIVNADGKDRPFCESVTKESAVSESIVDSVADADTNEPVMLIEQSQQPEFKFVGEAFRTYIIIEVDKELIFIDKHALHERIIYEQLRTSADNYSQMLLVPVTVTLDKNEYSVVVENLDMFRECGFDVEDFGMPMILVRSAPQYITGEDISDTITEMAGYICDNKRDIRSEKMDWIFHNVACRAAVKAGNSSSEAELRDLALKMLSDDTLRYCPHGRPVSITFKKSTIEKQFGRA